MFRPRLCESLLTASTLLLIFLTPHGARAQASRHLWNGKDLEGWQHVGPGGFEIRDGLLVTEGGMGLLWYTKEKLADVRLRVVYRVDKAEANSGIFIRIPQPPKDPWQAVHTGYEVQIAGGEEADDFHRTGALYSLTEAKADPARVGEWNTVDIDLDGPRTRVHVNGELVTDFREGDPVPEKKEWYEPERGPRPDSGYVGLQNHGEGDVVTFQEVSVHPLPKKEQAP